MQVSGGNRGDHCSMVGRPPSVAGHDDPRRIRRLQRLSGDADMAAHGRRLRCQSVPKRHGGAEPGFGSFGYTGFAALRDCRICLSRSASTRGSVEFRDLTFAYAADHAPVLKNINLVIPPGRVCGIVGETGSGKSTLVSLLLRLFEPPDGTVFVDGADIKRLPVAEVDGRRRLRLARHLSFFRNASTTIFCSALTTSMAKRQEAARVAQLLPAIESSAINSKPSSASAASASPAAKNREPLWPERSSRTHRF